MTVSFIGLMARLIQVVGTLPGFPRTGFQNQPLLSGKAFLSWSCALSLVSLGELELSHCSSIYLNFLKLPYKVHVFLQAVQKF